MDPRAVYARLDEIKSSDDFIAEAGTLAEGPEADSEGKEVAIEPILRFMEANPTLDFGTPGPLVHFVERFYGRGYEAKLIESILRCPTLATVWMLNRVQLRGLSTLLGLTSWTIFPRSSTLCGERFWGQDRLDMLEEAIVRSTSGTWAAPSRGPADDARLASTARVIDGSAHYAPLR